MKRFIEKSYSKVMKKIFKISNPIKKQIIKTECKVHKFINNQAIVILKNDGYLNEYMYYSSYIKDINAGAVWADQDYKSSNHFYNPESEKGLYGFSNAHKECLHYYAKALTKYMLDDNRCAMHYLGAACHLVQDVTVPQHVNIRLLKNHRKYEQWVIKMYDHHNEFKVTDSGIYLNSVKAYMDFNSKVALKAYTDYENEGDQNVRFYKTTLIILTTAQKTTAGLLVNFYKDIEKIRVKSLDVVERRIKIKR